MTGRARVRGVIAAAREMADGAELLLDVAPTPAKADPSDADAALLGVLLALADQAMDEQQREAGR